MSNLNEDQFGAYRGQHQPDPSGYRMHEAHEAFPDIHEHPEYYNFDAPGYGRSLRAISKSRGNPEQHISIYRAVPKGVTKIQEGDWVTPSKEYAQQHAKHPTDPKQDMPVIHKLARAKDLRTPGDDVNEWGYYPEKNV